MRERIKGKDFEQGGVYEVYNKSNSSLGIYFYPTSYPQKMEFEYNTRGTLSKLFNKVSRPLELLILHGGIYSRTKGKYVKFDKTKIYGKKPISIIKSESIWAESIDLSGLDLSYAKLDNSHLVRVNLSKTNLSHADLTGVDFTGSNLTEINLAGAKLGKTILKDIESSQITGSPDILPKGYYLVDKCIIGPDTKIPESLSNKYRQIKIGNGNNMKQYLVGPNVDLIGVDLSQIKQFDLNNADLTGANLTNVVLTGVYLPDVNFTGANLTGADLSSAQFYDCNFTGANLTDAVLTNTYLNDKVILTGIKSSLIKGIPKRLPKGYFLVDGIIIGPDIDIPNNKNNTFNTIILKKKYKKIKITIKNKNKNITKEYLIGPKVDLYRANLTGADLTGVNLTGSDLTSVNLTDVNLTDVDLTDVDLTNADLTGIKSGGIKGIPKSLPNIYVLINGYIIGPNVNLTGADLTGINLTNVNLTDVNLTDVDLTDVDLTNADLTEIKSGGIKGNPILPSKYVLINGYIIGPNVNLTGADLSGAKLSNVDLSYADLSDADLSDADLTKSYLWYINLTDANLTGIKSGEIKGSIEKLPAGYILTKGYIIGPNVNLTGADLTYTKLVDVDLTNADLSNFDLSGVNSGGIKGNPRLPSGYVLINGYIIGPNVNLTGADLTDVDLSNIDLTGIISGGIKGNPRLPSKYVLINGYIIGPNVNLTGADLTDANLSDIDLTGIKSRRIKGEPKLPKRYVLIGEFIIGPNVNLSDNVFYKLDLSYVNLSGANLAKVKIYSNCLLSFANLKKANLTGAKLVGVDLTRANLNGAYLSGTTLSENSLSKKQKSEIIGEPIYEANEVNNTIIRISKRITDGKNKINKEQMDRAKLAIKSKNNKNAIQEEYNKRMERKRKQNEEEKKESIKQRFTEKEKREPTSNEINRIYENTISKNTKRNNKNFSDLLDYLLDKKNQGRILEYSIFSIFGETGINAGGLTISIFDKCNKIFIERYFKEYSFEENNYQILKNLNDELFEEFKKACIFMIFFAKKAENIIKIKEAVKILIKINPQLLELLQLGELKYYKKLLNNSNNSFSLKRIKEGINDPFNSNNRLNSFSLKRIQNEVNNITGSSFNLKRIQRQKRYNINENKIIESDFFKQLLENNGIFDLKHFGKVKEFYILFWKANPTIFTNHVDYSWDNFKQRLLFQLPNSGISISFDELMKAEYSEINTYPFIKLILDYLKYSDEYRMRFTTLSCSSYTYSGNIYIQIYNRNSILDPFNAHTCFQTIDVNINLSDRYPKLYNLLFCESKNREENVRGNRNENESGRGNRNENESGRGNRNENESGRGNPNCRYSIEKLDILIRHSINQGFNIA